MNKDGFDENNDAYSYGNEDLALLFRRASRMMARSFHRRAHAHHAQEHVLSIIREQGPMKQSALLELLDVRSSSLSEVLGKLERNGLIERRRDEKDKRSFVIRAIQNAVPAAVMQDDGVRESADALFDCLEEAERSQLGTLLEKIIDSLKHDRLCGEGEEELCERGRHRHNHLEHRGRGCDKRFGGSDGHGPDCGKTGKGPMRGGPGGRGGFRRKKGDN